MIPSTKDPGPSLPHLQGASPQSWTCQDGGMNSSCLDLGEVCRIAFNTKRRSNFFGSSSPQKGICRDFPVNFSMDMVCEPGSNYSFSKPIRLFCCLCLSNLLVHSSFGFRTSQPSERARKQTWLQPPAPFQKHVANGFAT